MHCNCSWPFPPLPRDGTEWKTPFAGERDRYLLTMGVLMGSRTECSAWPISAHPQTQHPPACSSSFSSLLPPPHPGHPHQQHLILIIPSHSPYSYIQLDSFFISSCPPHWSCALSSPQHEVNPPAPPACPHLHHCCSHSQISPLQSQTRYLYFYSVSSSALCW